MTADAPPTYSVSQLNSAIGSLLDRGFAPRFLVQATASRPQIKKGHLWLTLTDGDASITAVAWASKVQQLDYVPADGDGVTVVGKLNFWGARASLAVQILDVRPSLTTVLRRFEAVRTLLESEGVIDPHRRRPLPRCPRRVAILTSAPSSALADILRTASDRWPMTDLMVVPIPVQGEVGERICSALEQIQNGLGEIRADAIVMARGGGSREDLAVFDDERLCRILASFPVPVVTGIGHEDDLTVADLVADHRAATPTAAIVALLPDRNSAAIQLSERKRMLHRQMLWGLERKRRSLIEQRERWAACPPSALLDLRRSPLRPRPHLLPALPPQRWLSRGFAILESPQGDVIRSVHDVTSGDALIVRLEDGALDVDVQRTHADGTDRGATP